ncbi:MAG: ABC transporter ATP-binding protein [Candidatus Hydrogenedentes bacterium]|nr:ABC transporter ATP-binding protein [Candidatus Hydrogenedentota bacterium]
MSEGYHFEDELQRKSYDAQIMRRLLRYVRPYRGWFIAATLLLILVALTSNLTPLLMMWSVDHYINNPTRLGADAAGAASQAILDMQGLFQMILIIALLVIVEGIVRYLQMLVVAFVGQKTMLEMRMELFDHLQRMSLRFLDRNPVGRLMSRVTTDIEKIQQSIVTGVVEVISDLLTIGIVLVFMFAVNWRLAFVALSPVPFVFITSYIFRKYAHHSFLEIRRKVARLSAFMQETITGMRIVQIFGREQDHANRFDALNADHRDEWLTQIRNFALYFPVVEFFSASSTCLIILYCAWNILDLGQAVSGVASIGTFFGYVFWAERLFGPIRALADRYNLLLEAMASSERVFQLLDTPEDIMDKPSALNPGTLEGNVEFNNVWFAYEPEQWVLKNVSFRIAPGERVAIVGHTGAGKSTIINLLSRFYDVRQGAILVDGVDVRDYQQVALRRHVGIVLQDVFLFSGTIEQNIRLGDTEMSEAHVRACAEYVNAAKFIEKLPRQYQYEVGERGGNLSTGQRQLLAFARTLAHRPQILVLDEATSSIDTETEALIQDAIEKLMEGRTSIVIAHRLSTVQHADRIMVLHHGELRESGTHQELLAHGGLYRTLYELQYKGQDRHHARVANM